jgi:hypothetical protein
MAYPTKPSIQTSYTAVEQALGDGTLPGQELDVDFANLKFAVDALNDFVRGITRSDGRLANASVSRDTLGPDILIGFGAPTTWGPGENYQPPETVFFSDGFYLCTVPHTSGVDFATDLAANRWSLLVDFAAVLSGSLAAEAGAVAAEAGAVAALAEFRTRYIGAAASDPATDPAGGALIDGALYWNTAARRLKVYDVGTTAWYFVNPTPAEQTAINTVAGISGNVTTVAGISGNVTTVAGISGNVTTVAGNSTNINTVAGISGNVTTVAGNTTNINTVAGLTTEIAALPGQLSAAQAAATAAEAALDSFDDRYLGAKAVAPTLDNDGNALQVGAVYWDTVSNQMFTWSGAEWRPTFLTGNAVRALVTATGGQTVVTVPTYLVGANTISVFLNGLKVMVGTDYTETDQNTITFLIGLTGGDEVEVIVLQPYAIGTTGAESITTEYGVTLARLFELSAGSVANLLADTTLNPAVVPVGSVIEAGGFRYEVAATGASDQHVTTAGGVKLYVTQGATGWNVKAFGAVGDGVVNDTAAIQRVLDFVAGVGGQVYFPSGIYIVSGTAAGRALLLTTTNPVVICGDGWSSVIKLGATGGFNQVRPLVMQSSANVTVEAIKFDGNSALAPDAGEQRNNIFVRSSKHIRFSRVCSVNASGDGLNIGVLTGGAAGDTASIQVDACYFDDNQRNGLTLGGTNGWANISITNCYFGPGNDTQQIDIEPTDGAGFEDVLISGCTFKQQADDLDIYVLTSGRDIRNLVFTNNDAEGALLLRSAKDVMVTFNRIVSNSINVDPITIDRSCDNVVLHGNTITAADYPNAVIYAREVDALFPTKVRVTDNQIACNKKVVFFQDVDDLTISGNFITSSATTGPLLDFHAQSRDMSRLRMVGNTIEATAITTTAWASNFIATGSFLFLAATINQNVFVGSGLTVCVYGNSGTATQFDILNCIGNVIPSTATLFREASSQHRHTLVVGGSPGNGSPVYSVFGTPEGVLTARSGAMALRRDGGTGTSFYIKETGTGNTGWVAK